MAIILTFMAESPRGPVTLTSDLSGLDTFARGQEISTFFDSILSLQCGIYEVERKDQESRDACKARAETYPDVVIRDPVMVVS